MSLDIPTRFPLVTMPTNRGQNPEFDGKIINGYSELNPQTNEYDVIRRPAFRPDSTLNQTDGGRGIYSWVISPSSSTRIQVRFTSPTTTVYADNTAIGVVAAGFYDGFQPIQSATPYLFFKHSGDGYFTDGVSVTSIIDTTWVSFGANVLPGSASLNGRLYVLVAPDYVYGAANLNDAAVWSALNVIRANDNPDFGVAITRHLQYILVLKTLSAQVFYDAGNPTGSPLSPVEGVRIPYGCSNAASVVRIGDNTIWVGKSYDTNPGQLLHVVMLQGLQCEIISTVYISRLLNSYASITAAYSLSVDGHKFYCLQCYRSVDDTTHTLVFDLISGLWSEWELPAIIYMGAGNGGTYDLQPFIGATLTTTAGNNTDALVTAGASISIQLELITPNMDFGIDRWKTLSALYINGDQASGGTLQIRRSDNDYQKWSNFRTIDMSKEKPRVIDEGGFYKRAYNIRYTNDFGPIRLRSMGMQMDLGVS